MTDNKHNVFISWSGPRSKHAAVALRDWLPLVLQSAKPWMSEEDIDKGSRGLDEVGRALEGMRIGIICLTPENLTAPWILFESGALSKTLDARTRVCTYLLGGLRPQDVERPLGMFQATSSNEDDTKRLVHTINKALEGEPVPETNLDAVFEGMWPTLDHKLSSMPRVSSEAPTKRSMDNIVAEILEISRGAAAVSQESIEKMFTYFQAMDKRTAYITDLLTMANRTQIYRLTPATGSPADTEPRKTFVVKLKNSAQVHRVVGTSVEESKRQLAVMDHGQAVAAFLPSIVERWWEETKFDGTPTPSVDGE